jgi:hypothetical protein
MNNLNLNTTVDGQPPVDSPNGVQPAPFQQPQYQNNGFNRRGPGSYNNNNNGNMNGYQNNGYNRNARPYTSNGYNNNGQSNFNNGNGEVMLNEWNRPMADWGTPLPPDYELEK